MKLFRTLIPGIIALMLVVSSCKKEELNLDYSKTQTTQTKQSEGLIVLGKELEDPYSIKNMKKAYMNLKSTNSETPDIEIKPTHVYLRFLPKNEYEWSKLKSDTTMVLFDFPLDYEIVNLGTFYHDPSLPDSAITWQYCVLPIEYKIPDVKNEILYEVCIPSENDSVNLKHSKYNTFLTELEYESVKLTGNLIKEESKLKNTKGLLPSKWTPSGTLTYYDNSLGSDQPIVQATVHARWFTHIESALTDENGYFQTSQFRYEVNYAIKWQRQDFEIRDGRILQAWYNGPKQKGAWNDNINGGMSRMYAIIHRAAYDYYYNNPFGIQSPPQNYWYNNILSIAAFDWEDVDANGDTAPWRRWSGTAEIRIFKPSRDSRDIYATTIHELAHASHWDLDGRFQFYTADDIVTESWARGVQWEFARRIYAGYVPSYFGVYTGLVQDLIDGISGNDQVEGYTLQQIEQALRGAKSFDQWRDNLKNLYDNGTEQNLDALFTFWN